jgi:hypothetical protein
MHLCICVSIYLYIDASKPARARRDLQTRIAELDRMRSRVGRLSPDSDDGGRGGDAGGRVGRRSPDSDDGGRGGGAGGREDGDLGAVWGGVCGPGGDRHACELSRHSALNASGCYEYRI